MSENPRETNPRLLIPAVNAGAATVPIPILTPLAALITGHILNDGEMVLIIAKPSPWFIILDMLRFAAVVLILMIAAVIFDQHLPGHNRSYVEAGIAVLAARLMISILTWFARLYILTDLRILRLDGIFTLHVFDCPLRKIARTRILYTVRERLFFLGSIEIIPSDENFPICIWQMIPRPRETNDQIIAAINRARGTSVM